MFVKKDKDRARLVDAAMGRIPCDLSFENAKLVNVVTGEIYDAAVDVLDGVIVRVREDGRKAAVPSRETVDCGGRYLMPGYIDTHMHVESTMMVPENFGKQAILWGTTTAVTDPHEIGNVMGVDGVAFMLESALRSPLRQYVLAPSCVPSVPGLEGAGAAFLAPEIANLLDRDGVIGVAEIMDYIGVYNNDPRMRAIIEEGLKRGMFLQGHSPSVHGDELCAYLCGGPVSCHEAREPQEVVEKLRLGMHINVKSSSLSDTTEAVVGGIRSLPWNDNVSICTDDVHASDLLKEGHISHVVNVCVQSGLDPLLATRFATYNAAREYHFDDLGAIAPGYLADIQLADALGGAMPYAVYREGKLVAREGKLVGDAPVPTAYPHVNTVNIPQIQSPDDFRLAAPLREGEASVILFDTRRDAMRPGQPLVYGKLPVKDGCVDLSGHPELTSVCIVNRYGSGDKTIVPALHFELTGAVASTISHDSHNLTVCYSDPESAYAAAKELERVGGGMCVARDGKVIATLPLPVAGLMSPLPCKELAEQIDAFGEALASISKNADDMLLRIAILALPVRPGYIITDRGVVSGDTQRFVPVFEK